MNPLRLLALTTVLIATCPARAELTKDVEYGRAGGESLKLDAFVPAGPGPFPAVILVHGGGWTSGDKSGGPNKALIAPMQDPLGQAGIAWFSINYRLAPAHQYPACFDDVMTALKWVHAHAAEYRLDPKRIALAGESAGAHLAALAAVRADQDTPVAAVVAFYAPSDLAGLYSPGATLTPNQAALFNRTVADDATLAMLRAASPITYVRPGLPPFLLLHGTADARVPYTQSTTFQSALRAAGVTCDLITIPEGAHGMTGWAAHVPDFKARVVAWLQQRW